MASATKTGYCLTSTTKTLAMPHLHIGHVLCSRSQGSIQFLWKRWLVEEGNQRVRFHTMKTVHVAAMKAHLETPTIYSFWNGLPYFATSFS